MKPDFHASVQNDYKDGESICVEATPAGVVVTTRRIDAQAPHVMTMSHQQYVNLRETLNLADPLVQMGARVKRWPDA